MAKVDILIPAFNAAKYLPAAIQSVLSQTFEDWQIVLVDDGSTDNTAEVVAPYLALCGSKLKYIHQSNRGLPAARNTAIRASTSEFLALLDADDVWLPDRLTQSLKAFGGRLGVGIAYGLITQIDPEGNLGYTFPGNSAPAEGWIASRIYMRKLELPCPTLTFRRRCVDDVGLFDETMRATEDRDLWLRIALKYEVAFIPKVIAYYRVSPNSMSMDPHRMLKSQLQFIKKHYGSPGCGLRPRQIAWARAYKQRAEAFKRQNKPWAALTSALQAVAIYPFDPDNSRTSASLLWNLLAAAVGR